MKPECRLSFPSIDGKLSSETKSRSDAQLKEKKVHNPVYNKLYRLMVVERQ